MSLSTPLPSAVQSSSGNSDNFTVPQDADLRVDLDVTADVAGTTLDVLIQHSEDNGVSWKTIGAFAQVGSTTPATESIAIQGPTSGVCRVNFTIVGTSYTFSVTVRSRSGA